MKLIVALFAVVVCFATSKSYAGFFLEPYGGYSMGNVSYTLKTTGATTSPTTSGLIYGITGGFIFPMGFGIGAEYEALSGKEKANTVEVDWEQSTIYGKVGYYRPMSFRVYGAYGFSHETKEKTPTLPSTYKGDAYKVGLGWEFVKHVAVDAEYVMFTEKDVSNSTGSATVSSVFSKYESSAFRVLVSFPWDFSGK
jgi:hypothetical protein